MWGQPQPQQRNKKRLKEEGVRAAKKGGQVLQLELATVATAEDTRRAGHTVTIQS